MVQWGRWDVFVLMEYLAVLYCMYSSDKSRWEINYSTMQSGNGRIKLHTILCLLQQLWKPSWLDYISIKLSLTGFLEFNWACFQIFKFQLSTESKKRTFKPNSPLRFFVTRNDRSCQFTFLHTHQTFKNPFQKKPISLSLLPTFHFVSIPNF